MPEKSTCRWNGILRPRSAMNPTHPSEHHPVPSVSEHQEMWIRSSNSIHAGTLCSQPYDLRRHMRTSTKSFRKIMQGVPTTRWTVNSSYTHSNHENIWKDVFTRIRVGRALTQLIPSGWELCGLPSAYMVLFKQAVQGFSAPLTALLQRVPGFAFPISASHIKFFRL